ncbi:Uma2 family endonuclease [Leptolyngbya ohadii]|uniref:Uma2 family endonuclease n=1 Tax=Leptolyngbya ohadii TaxID=1962290 RepID=UPI000B5A135D|nr:Uma2 family endonuclease [Leptolyngbya ohadii]
MLQYNRLHPLPSAEELPCSDDTPVDNELQNLIPNLLEELLTVIWAERQDWFFGVDMGIYYAPSKPAIVPDGFLSLGVDRFIHEEGRLSYVLWDEDDVIPIFALEVVSRTYGREYEEKKQLYAEIGVLYYAVYTPSRRYRKNRQPLEVYRLEGEEYVMLPGEQVWMPEIGLSIGRERGTFRGRNREWLYWYDEQGQRWLTSEEKAMQERQRAEQERRKADREQQRAEQERQRAEEERQRAEQESLRAEQESLRAEQESLRAEQERQRAEQQQQRAEEERRRAEEERQRADRLAERLRQLGVDLTDL